MNSVWQKSSMNITFNGEMLEIFFVKNKTFKKVVFFFKIPFM